MRVLLITGKPTRPDLEKVIETLPPSNRYDVADAGVSVAALLSTAVVRRVIEQRGAELPDLVLLPGLVPWDARPLESEFGIAVRKGPRNYRDIPKVFELDLPGNLSTDRPADELLKTNFEGELDAHLSRLEADPATFEGLGNFKIELDGNSLSVGRDFPPVVVAQIIDAPRLSLEKIRSHVEYYTSRGARVIDVGAVSKRSFASKLGLIISSIKEEYGVPVAVDSMRDEEILEGIDNGADIVLSVDLGNLHLLDQIPKDRVVVAIPTNQAGGQFERGVEARVRNLDTVVDALVSAGFKKILADPLLESPVNPGILPALSALHAFSRQAKHGVPLMLGVENVTEMCDFDSPGVNALLASVAIEVGAGFLLTTEYSAKTRGSVEELRRGIDIAYFAGIKGGPPKDFPVDALFSKSKRRGDHAPVFDPKCLTEAPEDPNFKPDPGGYFKVFTNLETRDILAFHYSREHELTRVVSGKSAEAVGKKLLEIGLVGNLEHALYLGRELSRAELSLSTNKSYVQEE
ncbi:MAG: dihydropteroate synthase-like protein [Promethearchaeota archaeon]